MHETKHGSTAPMLPRSEHEGSPARAHVPSLAGPSGYHTGALARWLPPQSGDQAASVTAPSEDAASGSLRRRPPSAKCLPARTCGGLRAAARADLSTLRRASRGHSGRPRARARRAACARARVSCDLTRRYSVGARSVTRAMPWRLDSSCGPRHWADFRPCFACLPCARLCPR